MTIKVMLSNFDKNLTILTTRWFQNSLMREKEFCNLLLLHLKRKTVKGVSNTEQKQYLFHQRRQIFIDENIITSFDRTSIFLFSISRLVL